MDERPTTAIVNGRLWGASAHDWSSIQERTCLPVYEAAFDRLSVGPGMRYLDAGCGAGLAAQRARARCAAVSGLDAAENLLEIARQRTPDGEFLLGRLEELPFPDAAFDIVTGFNSFQYAIDAKAALAEARRVTRQGGQVLVMTWGDPKGMDAASLVAALRPLLPLPPPGAPGPFALSDEHALRGFAASASLDVVEVFDVDFPWVYANLEEALRGLGSSGVAARAQENSGREALDHAHVEALKPFRQLDGSYRIGAQFRCLLARA